MPTPAYAAACCLSAAVFGVGRLAVWENAAVGLIAGGALDAGRWGPDGRWRAFPANYTQAEVRTDVWGIVRLHERGQLSARVPWVEGVRAAPGVGTIVAGGVGDVLVAGRWELVMPGERRFWPAIAVTSSVTAPTATRVEQTKDLLGAGTTGRGAWAGGLAVAVEQAVLPHFIRLDAGISLPAGFERQDLGVQQSYGLGWQVALSAGRELVADKVVVGLQLLAAGERPYTLDGVTEARSGVRGLNAGLSGSWRFAPDWTWTVSASSDAPSALLDPRNQTERWLVNTGVRYAFSY